MSWGTRRRNNIIFFVFLILIIPIVVGAFLIFYEKPTCFDGKKNGNEKGIDCGGSCVLLCTEDTLPPIVVWERYFKISEGNYNVATYIENQNPSAGAKEAKYIFELFNKEGVQIAEREGRVRLLPKSITPIIESGLFTGKQDVERMRFRFLEDVLFEKEEPIDPVLIIKNDRYYIDESLAGGPRVTASVQNISLNTVKNIEIVVLLYDIFDNVAGSSSTFIDEIKAEETKDISFTWPDKFVETDLRPEIIPIYDPDN